MFWPVTLTAVRCAMRAFSAVLIPEKVLVTTASQCSVDDAGPGRLGLGAPGGVGLSGADVEAGEHLAAGPLGAGQQLAVGGRHGADLLGENEEGGLVSAQQVVPGGRRGVRERGQARGR